MQLNYEKFEPPDWFNSELSLLLPLPQDNYVKDNTNINFGLKEYNDKFNQHFSFLAVDNIIEYKTTNISKSINNTKEEILQKKSQKLKFAKNVSSFKSIETKFDNKINNLDKTTVSFTFRIFPTSKQINKIKVWINEALIIYNCCVDIHNSDFYYFNKGYMSAKLDIFDYLGGQFNCPYDSRTDAVKKFCDNLSSAKSNYMKGNIKKFLMKKKNIDNAQNIFIPKTSITKDSCYPAHLGKMKGIKEFFLENNINENLIGDSYLRYDTLKNEYFFILSYHKAKKNIQNRKKVVAIDPGEVIPFSYFSEDGFGNLGMNIREKILKEQQKIKKLQSILNKNLNRENKSIKNKRSLRKRINRHFTNIKNYVKELHNKVALFFVKNYDTILIPEFRTQQMISNKNRVNYVLNLEMNINTTKEELLEKIEGKSLEEINDILNLFIKKENIVENNIDIKEQYKIENKEKRFVSKYHEQIDKIKKLEKFSTEEKKDLINTTKELINLENMCKKLKKNFDNLKKQDNNIMKKIIEDKGEKELAKINKNFNFYLSKIDEEMIKNLKDLGLEDKEIEKYMKDIKKEEEGNMRKRRVEENVKNIKETLKKQKENVEEIEKEKNEKRKEKNERLKNIFQLIKEKFGEEILKLYKKKITRKSRLNKRVKFVMQMLSHYKFRQHLQNKCKEYGCEMIVVTEEFTSITCTNCGKIEKNFRKREKICSNCGYKVNRDIGGARNIMIKNINKVADKYKNLGEIIKI